ncbi:glyoxalase/Bleomycin resistance protein/Dioxygenase superfamily protein [Asticcacaulis biprosthecium C19]|uniref:Glyoxalase/Bleomycin resistance protein/Dioxygenase superfamily protein n=1 Tax=Asticcacaulis biprosthecium C19 TaxID=715226 RepID=F4QJ38_9CAUL|nr:VOC family protein [Asticcacaulis biprosthecium]EGF91869.1 glyoxalase/Bleomycin resistance protein/Dioxygenase superfamily protein [Asticcacaulis biprosthecium C19]
MIVKNLNHINIQTRDMAQTIAFYEELLGLEARVAPERDPSLRQWLYDSRDMAVIHLNLWGTDNTIAREVVPGGHTGAIHHVAFECDGFDEMVRRLKARNLDYGFAEIPSIKLRQLFVTDPNNVLLELNFRG